MEIIAVPDSVDVQAFQFKRQRCVKVFDVAFPTLPTSLNLVAAASRLGVLFVGSPNNSLHVFQVRSLLAEEGPQARRRVFPLSACPVNLSLNCTQDLLCIVTNHNNSLVATIYLSKSCASENLSVFKEIRLSPSSGIQLCGLLWNPCMPDILAVCTSDGSLSVYQCKQTSLDVQAKQANARCLSWSPKGKQIVTGNADGSLSQYKPDLTLVKNIPPPQLFGPNHIEAISIHWISNYQFGIVYKDAQNPDNRPSVTIVNTPKAGAPNCFNYEDICYSMGVARPIQYYLSHFPTWGILLALSANSMEVGVLGTGDQVNWQQWIQMDDARAELPLTENKQENYPIGFAYDDAAIHQLSWGENETLPHMPMVHVLSHTGTLVTFFAINFAKDSPPLCSPPQELNIPDHWMIFDAQPIVHAQQPAPAVLPETPSNPQQDISFLPQNIATSTPTIPKSNSPFSQTGAKPVANLFGGGGGLDLQEVVKPLSEHHQNSGEVKPQQNVTSKLSSLLSKPAPQAQPEKPFSGFAKPSNFFKQPPPAQPEKVHDVQAVQSVASQAANAIKAHEDEEQGKSYETLLNQASNETIKALLLKEINEFQMELYELLKRCKSIDTKVGTANEMKEIIAVMEQYDREPPESIWSKQDVTQQITALKQSLIKMCSVLVKAKMQPETLELEQLAVLDPVSSGKLSAIKQNIYYIESQLKQVNNVLDDQWDVFQGECKKRMKAFRGLNDGDSMKLPTLDKVYQPLVRQHDILARQESTIRALQKLAESVKPQMLSSQIGRSLTNAYKDSHPLSALTKNLLNLSLQPIDILDAQHKAICEREAKHTPKKQNALRELLVNHHTVRIKPTKVEQSNRLQSFFDRNSLSSFESEPKKEIENIPVNNALKEPVKSAVPETGASKISTLNSKMMEAILRPTPQFSDNSQPLINLDKFVSNIPERAKPITPAVPTSTAASTSTYSDKIANQSPLVTALLQNKTPQQSAKPENIKTNVSAVITPSTPANVPTSVVNNQKSSTFMGQPICSPTPRSTGSIFGTATSPQVPFGSPTGNSVFSLPKQTTSSSATNATSSESSAFKTFAPPPVSKETSIFSTPKPQTTTPSSQGGVRNEVQKSTQETEKSGSSLTIGSLTISKVPSTSTPISAPSPAAATFTGSISSVSGTPTTTGSIFSTTSVPATSKPSAAPAVTTSAPPPSFTLSNAILTSSDAADSLFSQSSPSTASLPFGTQSTSIFGSAGSSGATSIFGGTSVSTTAAPAVSASVSPPSVATVAKPVPESSAITTTLATATPISSPPAASNIFGAVSSSPTPASVFSQPPTPQSVFGGAGATPGSVFGASAASTTTGSMFGGTVTSTPGFGSAPQAQPSAANSLFASANANITPGGSMFDALSVSPTSSPSSIFGSASADTNASSLFGAANAAVPSTISSLFGNASIATTSAPFGSPSNTGGSAFGGGAGFGSPSAFGQSGGSVFGGGGSAFGQPQTNVFGGGVAFGGFGATSPPASNIFGQAPALSGGSMFGSPASPVSQGSLFGGGSIQQGQSMFGTPTAASPQQGGSIFGSPTGQSSVFGGAATFGSKPVFGQTNSFGGSPTGSGGFGAFSGTGDQQNVASAGFGSPSAFSKPPGTFGGSPSFGSPTGFGAPSTFAPSFSSPIKPFGPPGTDSAFGNSQSSTFENLATQSTIGFGNLAQQSPPAQPAAPAFQGNPSFSMWR